jgi:hypothetical protein
MHPIDAHIKASKTANEQFRTKYGKDDFVIGSTEHKFWIDAYDKAFARTMIS